MSDAPILIIGGGPLGLAGAIALHHRGHRVQLVDARTAQACAEDKRVLALSHGSRQLLEALGAWPAGATPITRIHVSQRGALGRTLMEAAEHRLPALGYVLPAGLLHGALMARAQTLGISMQWQCRVNAWQADDEAVRVQAQGSEAPLDLRAPLLLCCEGAIDSEAPSAVVRDYDQHALLARVTPAKPHEGIAWERFTPDGPIALLPLGQDYAVVWTVSPHRLPQLMSLDDTALLQALQDAFGSRVTLTQLTQRASYPLGLRFRRKPVDRRVVWLGNAAQTLHPVAGQGFNLALRDTWELADTLGSVSDPGDAAALAHYAARRRADRMGAIGFTDLLVRVFSNDHPLLRHARGAGLLALDVLPPLRHFVAKRMLFGARAWP